ncbi:MAG: bacteriohemerythrin [Nitrospiraceae bacterium]|nr:bacteriohemerythrin [Nitrospiraceae bacterium]
MEWTEDLAVGVKRIDDQHKELFTRINGLVDAIRTGKCKETIDGTIQFLAEYALSHFREEEQCMADHRYPEFSRHKAQHAIFMRALDDLKKQAAEPRVKGMSYDLSVETNKVVVDWIITHIMRIDKKLGAFLRTGEMS